jgi:hypothetical protein
MTSSADWLRHGRIVLSTHSSDLAGDGCCDGAVGDGVTAGGGGVEVHEVARSTATSRYTAQGRNGRPVPSLTISPT